MPIGHRGKVVERIKVIAADPGASHPDVKPLKGLKDTRRLRVGDWRVIFHLVWIEDRLLVVEIDVRGGIY